jgi:hypothetical protein
VRSGDWSINNPRIPSTLWYIRDYALDQQQPVSQHSLFLRADWVDAFGRSVPWRSLTWVPGESDFGSQPQADTVLFKVVRYF